VKPELFVDPQVTSHVTALKYATEAYAGAVADLQAACQHDLVGETPSWGEFGGHVHPHRMCLRCRAEETARMMIGGWDLLRNTDHRLVTAIEWKSLYAMRLPLVLSPIRNSVRHID